MKCTQNQENKGIVNFSSLISMVPFSDNIDVQELSDDSKKCVVSEETPHCKKKVCHIYCHIDASDLTIHKLYIVRLCHYEIVRNMP